MVIVFRNSPHDKGSKSVESLRRHALIYAQGTLFLTRLCELKKKKMLTVPIEVFSKSRHRDRTGLIGCTAICGTGKEAMFSRLSDFSSMHLFFTPPPLGAGWCDCQEVVRRHRHQTQPVGTVHDSRTHFC